MTTVAIVLAATSIVLFFADKLAKRTKTPVDDAIVALVKEHAPALVEKVVSAVKSAKTK